MSVHIPFEYTPIGTLRSCFGEKFGTPRQAGLVPHAPASIELLPPYDVPEAIKGLSQFSHIWIIYLFDRVAGRPWHATVRPPRLGGNRRVGVFATRSNFRPNPIGLSVVKLDAIECQAGSVVLHVSGADVIDNTPVLDIKPYLPYADSRPDASASYATEPPARALTVRLAPEVERFCDLRNETHPRLREVLVEALSLDPRPAYRAGCDDTREYGTTLFGFNFHWQVHGDTLEVSTAE